jgi:hypothetical protein
MFFSDAKLEKLSDISSDIAQIFFASVFISPFFNTSADWKVIIFGLVLSLIFWSSSLLLIKE